LPILGGPPPRRGRSACDRPPEGTYEKWPGRIAHAGVRAGPETVSCAQSILTRFRRDFSAPDRGRFDRRVMLRYPDPLLYRQDPPQELHPGVDGSVLCECRSRLLAGDAGGLLLACCKAVGLLKTRG